MRCVLLGVTLLMAAGSIGTVIAQESSGPRLVAPSVTDKAIEDERYPGGLCDAAEVEIPGRWCSAFKYTAWMGA